jgi:hypothetical protein
MGLLGKEGMFNVATLGERTIMTRGLRTGHDEG